MRTIVNASTLLRICHSLMQSVSFCSLFEAITKRFLTNSDKSTISPLPRQSVAALTLFRKCSYSKQLIVKSYSNGKKPETEQTNGIRSTLRTLIFELARRRSNEVSIKSEPHSSQKRTEPSSSSSSSKNSGLSTNWNIILVHTSTNNQKKNKNKTCKRKLQQMTIRKINLYLV